GRGEGGVTFDDQDVLGHEGRLAERQRWENTLAEAIGAYLDRQSSVQSHVQAVRLGEQAGGRRAAGIRVRASGL
ncbi:MAG TPA: hypothetical protein VEY88_00175, partial [Archangium sp.]|nr:hypothetical protein [Archangium sp.]